MQLNERRIHLRDVADTHPGADADRKLRIHVDGHPADNYSPRTQFPHGSIPSTERFGGVAGRAYSAGMVEYPDARISVAERDRALLELSEHLGTGRLNVTEFEERTAAAAAAMTTHELAALFADLPGATHPAGEERIAIPWSACLVAAALLVAPPLAYFLHNALWLLLIPLTVGIWALARRDR